MYPKSTQISVDHQKLGTGKNLPKIMQNYLKSTPKNLVFKTPQNGFLFLGQTIKRKKYPKKKHYKFACFYAPQNGFLFLDQASWHMQKSLKNDRKSYSNLRFSTQMDFYFWTRKLGHFKKFNKNHGN
jgi:hypothetical protein